MTISELIKGLQETLDKEGDLKIEVCVYDKKSSLYPEAYCEIIPSRHGIYENIAWETIRLKIQLPDDLKIIKSKVK